MPAPAPFKTAVILTALDAEIRAVLRHMPGWTEETVDGTVFYRGRFGNWSVSVAEVGPGNASAAAVTERAIRRFDPRVALFVGVAGGAKDVAIGDVVIATKVYGYGSGKEDAKGFKARPEVFRTAHEIEQRGRALGKRDDWRERLNPTLTHSAPKVIVAPIAAGEKVLASTKGATAILLKTHYSDAVAVEMEGRGFLEGVHLSADVRGGVIRGISDLLDGKAQADKSGSQQRAADAASAATFEILSGLDGRTPGGAARQETTFTARPSTFTKAAYFPKGEVLARVGVPDVDQVAFSYFTGPDAYLRLMPTRNLERPLLLARLKDAGGTAPLLRPKGFNGVPTMNKYGAIRYDYSGSYRGGPAPLHWATQLFPSGELWCTTDTLIVRERDWRPTHVPIPLMPTLPMEQAFFATLYAAVAFAVEQMDLVFPAQVEFGLLNLEGVHITVPTEETWGPIHGDEVILTTTLADADPAILNEALLEFFNEVFDKAGFRRPEAMHHFPPGPPQQ